MPTTVTNTSNGNTLTGTGGTDRLTVIYDLVGDVTLNNFSGQLASGYSGFFAGPGGSNIQFAAFGNFTFTHNESGNDRIDHRRRQRHPQYRFRG